VREEIEERVLKAAEYILETGATVRRAAEICGCSKSTIHTDMTVRLPQMDARTAAEVRRVLDVNLAERHIRGGRATCEKYKKLHSGS